MTLDQLRILVTIADQGSVLAAAKILHRSQPTISVAIRKLEEELSVQLLDRSHYRASLSGAGIKLCEKARALLRHADQFTRLAGHLAAGNEPQLCLAIEASCPMPLVLNILRANEQKYPQTEFNLQMENIWGALEKVIRKEADLAISPWFEDLRDLESLRLTGSRLLTVAAPGFCPAEREASIETMKSYVQVVVRDSSRYPQLQKSYGVVEGGRHWIVSDHLTKKQLIAAGLGWGKLHEHLIAAELEAGLLVPLNIEHYPGTLEMEIRAVRRLGEPVGPVAAELWQDLNTIAVQ